MSKWANGSIDNGVAGFRVDVLDGWCSLGLTVEERQSGGLQRATLDAILAQGDRESGAAKSQVAAFATAVEKITQAHPKAANYKPGSIL